MHRLTRNSQKALFVITTMLVLFLAGNLISADYESREETPEKYKWNLSDIYPDWAAWEADMDKLQSLMDEYASMKGTLAQGAEVILKAYKMGDEMGMLSYKTYRYPGLANALDSRDNEIAGKLQQVQILFARFNIATSWFSPELLTIHWETMEKWLNETDDLAPYRYSIEDLYRQQKHVLDEEKEQLLSYFSTFNGSPSQVYQGMTSSDIEYKETVLSNGDTVTVTPATYYNIMNNNMNQADRAKTVKTFYSVYSDNINTYAAIYNGILQRDWAQAQARNYKSTLDANLDGNNIPEDVYTSLVATVKAGAAPVRKYYDLRKKVLDLDTLHLYDTSIPMVDFNKTYKYEDIQDWVVESVGILGKDYQKTLRQAFDERWIDVYETKGKSTGAFSANTYGVHPFLLLNYNETLRDVFTVAHELGHCMHSMLSNANQPFVNSSPTLFVAEVASTLNEALLLDYLYERTEDPKERISLLTQAIDNIIGTFYTQAVWANYELQAHQMVENGQPITAETVKQLYTGIMTDFYGESIVFDELYQSTWTRIGHFYWAPYYVYKYSTCFASSAQIMKGLASSDEKVRSETLDKYLTLLKSGSNDYPMEQLKKAGVDLTQPEAYQAVVDQLDGLVNRLEVEINKL